MKFSEAMLKGFEEVGGAQCRHRNYRLGPNGEKTAYCVMGAVYSSYYQGGGEDDFQSEWGIHPSTLNDDGMPWEHIYGMAVAAGL